MVATETFSSPEELAEFSSGSTAVYLVVGPLDDCSALIDEISDLVNETEKVVHVLANSVLFEQMEKPQAMPALGVWSSKGSLVGYREDDETVGEFVDYARRFT